MSVINKLASSLNRRDEAPNEGAMTALSSINLENPKVIYTSVSKILSAADKGSVITKDQAVNVLIKLCSVNAGDTFALLNKQLQTSPANQLPMYAEKALPVINEKYAPTFIKTLNSRLGDIDKDTKRKRVEKVIKKISDKKWL